LRLEDVLALHGDMRAACIFILLLPILCRAQNGAKTATYSGMCDASAAAALDADWFVAANDEDNVLRLFKRSKPGLPEATLDLTPFLDLGNKSPETDLEGAARIGSRIYWITSHGCNADGQNRPNRHRFFATDIVLASNAPPELVPAGTPCRRLLQDLIREPRLRAFKLDEAAGRAPKERNALNIEGLSATPEGHLLIGFRNPIPGGKALLVPLLNPAELVQDRPARFGDPLLLDLDGLGIRSMDYHQGRYVIVAGSYHGKGRSRLYVWQGGESAPVWIKELDLTGLNPEGLFFPEPSNAGLCEIISDDGTEMMDGTRCKDLKDPALKHFRTLTVDLGSYGKITR
jgi:hypothetical protein